MSGALRSWTFEEKLGEKRRDSTTELAGTTGETAASYCAPVLAYFYFWTGWRDEPQFSFECQRDLLKFISQREKKSQPSGLGGGEWSSFL